MTTIFPTPIRPFRRLFAGAILFLIISFAHSITPTHNNPPINPLPVDSMIQIHTSYRIEAHDVGVVYSHGNGPDGCDSIGARDVWVWEDRGTYYMHYDGCSANGWLVCLATSRDLQHWLPVGPQLKCGARGQLDASSASYGVTYHDKNLWQMFYLGSTKISDSVNFVPMFPYVIMRAVANSPGGPWRKQPFHVLLPQPLTYYALTVSPGQIIKQSDLYLMFISTSQQKFSAVGGEWSNSSTNQQKSNNSSNQRFIARTISIARSHHLEWGWVPDAKPILPIFEQVENASLFFQESTQTWFLFTNHVGFSNDGIEYTDAIYVYWTDDLEKWDSAHKAVVLDWKNCGWSKHIIGLPSVVKVGDQLALFYDGYGGPDISRGTTIHTKRDIGLAWLDLPIVVPDK